MSIENKLITAGSLESLVLKLKGEGLQIFAPVEKNKSIEFAEISSTNEMAKEYIATVQSAKFAAFPKAETLFDIAKSKKSVSLTNRNNEQLNGIVLLGSRPCDAVGFDSLNAIFNWDGLHDNNFANKLERITIIGISCKNFDGKCFCTSVNGGPGNTKGSDILLTAMENNNYLAEIITEKGKAIVDKYPDLFAAAPEVDKNKYLANVPVAFNIENILKGIGSNFEHRTWMEQSLRCITCGACAFVCPTCACFDMQDVTYGQQGHRKRSWDSCGFSLFTMHTTGHNPREIQSQRWRQRVMHKFSYMPQRQQIIGCVGCGRCSRACPVDMNLKEHLTKLEKEIN